MVKSNTNPHIREVNSPLNALAMQALRRYGDFNPGTVDGDVMLMFVEFANMVIDEIRMHPYWDGTEIDYYISPTDVRPVNDQILVAGLLYHYAAQQMSEKLQILTPQFQRTMNQRLWEQYNGGNSKIQLRITDGGTNKRNLNGAKTNTKNGTVSY